VGGIRGHLEERKIKDSRDHERCLRPKPAVTIEEGNKGIPLSFQVIVDVKMTGTVTAGGGDSCPQEELHPPTVTPSGLFRDEGITEEPEHPSIRKDYRIGSITTIPAVTIGKCRDAGTLLGYGRAGKEETEDED